MRGRQLLRSALLTTCALTASVAAPTGAAADTTTSSNWAGYAAHRPGVTFRHVSASWIQPTATCRSGQRTYSSFWVGIGGYDNATGLEQIGTSLDCGVSGQHHSSAWYELVPAPAHPLSMIVRQGDRLSASVTVAGHEVTVRLRDLTRGESFARQLTDPSTDMTSAEWIAEAPSACSGTGFCVGLPLANFGTANFAGGTAQTTVGQRDVISSGGWNRTRIVLSQGPSQFNGFDSTRTATPSPLQAGGTAFGVRYQESPAFGPSPARASSASFAAAVQPGGPRR